MAFHHVALATTDIDATHRFYTGAMGFTLVKTVVAPTGSPGGGWAKHVFYDTGGGGMLAVWDLHDDTISTDFNPAISKGLGLPEWVNHIAFDSPDLEDFDRCRRRWQEHGVEVAEIDHGWCRSIYATDPNGIMVEFCCTTVAFTASDAAEAAQNLAAAAPEPEPMPEITFHPALAPEGAH
ncbi:MAG: VOC family protein [Acidimicrobiales bacterium]|jgi:catechol 2,3-dioxygenase-like lactoylglutathione lyase family enzyme